MRGYRVTGEQRARYREEGMPLLFLAYGLLQAGIAALIDPDAAEATSVARLLPRGFELIWQGAYVLAGIAIAYGVLRPRPIVEAVGLQLAGWALGINLLALLLLRGPAGSGTALAAFLIALVIVIWRIHVLHRRARSDRRTMQRIFDGPDRRRA